MKNSSIFKVGFKDIGWLDSDFPERFPNVDFQERPLGTFKTLTKYTSVANILSEKLAEECELGDVLAFLENPPEETKDGYANIFIIKNTSFVVGVGWRARGGGWRVSTWSRGSVWGAGRRVFSPATVSAPRTLEPSDPIAFEIRNLTKEVKRLADFLESSRNEEMQKKVVKAKKSKRK